MASAIFYTLSKRHNSTLQVSGTGTSVTVDLKGGSDLIDPALTLAYSGVPSWSLFTFEGRQYFVTGIKSVRQDLWEISGHVDVLGTYKSDIQATSAHVLYYTHANNEVVDNRLSVKTTPTISSDTETFNNLGTGNVFMLTVVGMDGTTMYGVDAANLKAIFTQTLLNNIANNFSGALASFKSDVQNLNLTSVMTVLEGLGEIACDYLDFVAQNSNAIQYSSDAAKFIKNCFVLPVDPLNLGGTSDYINFGYFQSSQFGLTGFPRILHDSATVSIPWQASDWRRNSPYHFIYLYIPYVGLISIPASEIIGSNTLTVDASLDTYSGACYFRVSAANGVVIGQYCANLAAPYAVGDANINILTASSEVIGSAGAVAATAITGGAGGAAAGAGMSLGISNSLQPLDISIASNGGGAGMGLGSTVKIFSVFHDTNVAPSSMSAVKGTPYNGVMSLSGVSGYVQTSGASVSGSMTDAEREEINSLMDGGFYVE